MKPTRKDGLFLWNVYQPDRRIDFNGFYWARHGGVLVDPMPLSDTAIAWLREHGGVRWIVVTNADHVRAAPELRAAFGARVLAPETDRAVLEASQADAWFGETTPLPAELAMTTEVRWLHGGKTGAEAVLYFRPLRAILFGDAVRSHEIGRLRLLPDAKVADRARLIADVRSLADLEFDAILLGDGDCLFTGARRAFDELLATLA
ncbi:MAG: MBL fold metallo-hydrolase [Planctomycetes bacterium]|nr:MBL fold metallo-hydrolase [Planctomycetota bacterium]